MSCSVECLGHGLSVCCHSLPVGKLTKLCAPQGSDTVTQRSGLLGRPQKVVNLQQWLGLSLLCREALTSSLVEHHAT